MSTPAVLPWIQYDEDVVAENEPNGLDDVANRPLKFIITQSDFAEDDTFPGFMARWTGTDSPEGVIVAPAGHAFVDTTNSNFYIKMTPSGNTGWMLIGAGNLFGDDSPEGVVTGSVGQLYEQRNAADTEHPVWFKASGTDTTTLWRKFAGFIDNNSVVVGDTCVWTSFSVVIGQANEAGDEATAIGTGAFANASQAVALGKGVNTFTDGAPQSIAIGAFPSVHSTATDGIAIGTSTSVATGATQAIAIGKSNQAAAAHQIIIGDGITADADNASAIYIGNTFTIPSDAGPLLGIGSSFTVVGNHPLGLMLIGRSITMSTSSGGVGGSPPVLIGYSINGTGTASYDEIVVVGSNITLAGGDNATIVGSEITVGAPGNGHVILGGGITVGTGQLHVVIGAGAQAAGSGSNCVIIGQGAQKASAVAGGVAVGDTATLAAGSSFSTAIGASTSVGAASGTICGESSTITHDHCIILGSGLASYATNTVMIGQNRTSNVIATLHVGAGDTRATATPILFRLTNGSGSNLVAGDLTIQPGLSTGNAAEGVVKIQIGDAAASGSTLQTAAIKFIVGRTVTVGATAGTTSAFLVSLAMTAPSTAARCISAASTLTASANNNVLSCIRAASAFDAGAFTGVTTIGLEIDVGSGGAVNYAIRSTSSRVNFGTATDNTFNVAGMTINQGADDTEIISLKSSDVAHGMTTQTDTDTYGYIRKAASDDGGIRIFGFTEITIAALIRGAQTTEDTTKSTAAIAPVVLDALTKSGTTVTTPGANTNLVTIRSGVITRFIFDADGDSHQDVGTAWTNFDTHDDVALLNKLSAHVSRRDDPLRQSFGRWLQESRDDLQRLKLVTFNDDGHHFVNMSRLSMLHTGAIRQLGEKLNKIEQALISAKLLPAEV